MSELPTIDEIKRLLYRLQSDVAQETEDVLTTKGTLIRLPMDARNKPIQEAIEKLMAAERLAELKWLLDNHDSENSFGYFIQDRIKELERHNNE